MNESIKKEKKKELVLLSKSFTDDFTIFSLQAADQFVGSQYDA